LASQRLIPALFQSRPNRFLAEVRLSSGRLARAHLADPGRLRELLIPGAALRLRPASQEGSRQTRYTVALVRAPDSPRAWVSLNPALANRLAEDLLVQGKVSGVGRGWMLRREVRRGRSRFDFLLRGRGGAEILVEVKSVTLVVGGVARFPDAPTRRGARHLRELEKEVRSGGRALVLFIVQREDACAVSSNPEIDPGFASAVASAARTGVLLRAARFRMNPSGGAAYLGTVPLRAF